jgi:threonyl-tRNA synthetase
MQSGSVAVRSRKRGDEGMLSIENFIKNVETEIREKK